MAKILDVYFHEKIVGQLGQDDHGDINFTYSISWLNDPTAIKISHSLPLQGKTFKRKECRAFFEGILPEENQRKIIARNLGISANNDFSMLEKIGGECAGALSFIPAGDKLNLKNNNYHELTDTASSTPVIDLDKMINAVIFNYRIGNYDAHGKNFSLLYLDQVQLAPLYDLICTLYYKDLDKKMAMKLGGEYQIIHVTAKNFDLLADEVGLAKPEVRRRIIELSEAILSLLPRIEIMHPVQEGMKELIEARCMDFSKNVRKN